jgi:hypothetical protein
MKCEKPNKAGSLDEEIRILRILKGPRTPTSVFLAKFFPFSSGRDQKIGSLFSVLLRPVVGFSLPDNSISHFPFMVSSIRILPRPNSCGVVTRSSERRSSRFSRCFIRQHSDSLSTKSPAFHLNFRSQRTISSGFLHTRAARAVASVFSAAKRDRTNPLPRRQSSQISTTGSTFLAGAFSGPWISTSSYWDKV